MSKKNTVLDKDLDLCSVNMNYFYIKLDFNLCQTRLKSKVVVPNWVIMTF